MVERKAKVRIFLIFNSFFLKNFIMISYLYKSLLNHHSGFLKIYKLEDKVFLYFMIIFLLWNQKHQL
jgi:hypothetical protein